MSSEEAPGEGPAGAVARVVLVLAGVAISSLPSSMPAVSSQQGRPGDDRSCRSRSNNFPLHCFRTGVSFYS